MDSDMPGFATNYQYFVVFSSSQGSRLPRSCLLVGQQPSELADSLHPISLQRSHPCRSPPHHRACISPPAEAVSLYFFCTHQKDDTQVNFNGPSQSKQVAPVGCKRFVFDTGWSPRENTTMVKIKNKKTTLAR